MLEHIKNISLWTMQSIQIWKICWLVCMMYFVFWVFTNSVLFTSHSIILYHNYLNKRKKCFENILSRSSYLGFTSLNAVPVCFLKHPCKQFSFLLDISSISLQTCYILPRFNVIIFLTLYFLSNIQFYTHHTP